MGCVLRGMLAAAVMATAATAQEAAVSAPGAPAGMIIAQDPPKVVPRVLDRATPENTRIVISLGRQRAYLHVGEEVAIDTPVSTGKRRAQTPTGDFAVTEKIATQRSNRHGDFVDAEGRTVRHGVSARVDVAPSGTSFRVVPVQYCLQLGGEGLAIYAGRLPGYPSADTGVRLPPDIAPLVYQRVKVGTPVKIAE